MLVIRVELWSAITGVKTEIARMDICNVGGTKTRGDYECRTIHGRDKEKLDHSHRNGRHTRKGEVKDHPRLASHVWNLVAKALNNMEYGK